MKVLLTGASGFVGSHVLARLRKEGHQVRALVREPGLLASAGGGGHVEAVAGDIVKDLGVREAMAGMDAVIHLVGIIMESRGATFEGVHHHGTRNVVAAAAKAGIKRFVHMSALGARAKGVSGYQTSKWQGEEEVRRSGLPYVILRPSIIFGPRDGFITQMVKVMKSAPLVRPVPGSGNYKFRPIFIDNVVDCFVQSLTSEKALNRSIDLVGPEEMTLRALLARLAECVLVDKPALRVPYPIMYMNAALIGMVMSRPPVTTDQLRMLKEGSTSDPRPMLETFKLHPFGFKEGLNTYLCGRRS